MNRNARAAIVVAACLITAVVVAHGNAVSDDPPAPLSTPTPAPTAKAMPHCVNEDGSGGSGLPCRWTGSKDGNGVGLSFIIHTSGRIEYTMPAHWPHVGHELADALAEGGTPHADTYRWERCVVDDRHYMVVICPDGLSVDL